MASDAAIPPITGNGTNGRAPRRLPYWGFALVVIAYLAIIQLGGMLAERLGGLEDGEATQTTRGVLIGMGIPLGAALLFTYGVVAALGWWRPVLRDDRPVRRWLIVVPIVLAVAIVLGIDYATLARKDAAFILALLLVTQFVGWGEEGMFRGIGVTTLRTHGLREWQVALWSSVIFGAVHLSNALSTGFRALPQALAVSFAGYFFYLVRRRTGGNAINSVLHGLFDFSILSGTVLLADQGGYIGNIAPIAAYPILALILLIRRHQIEPATSPGAHEASAEQSPRQP